MSKDRDTVMLAVHVSPSFAGAFSRLARSQDRSTSAEMRRALRAHLLEQGIPFSEDTDSSPEPQGEAA